MSKIFLNTDNPRHFLIDSKGDLYEVSEELANKHAAMYPSSTAMVDHVDAEKKTIWFVNPLPEGVKADGNAVQKTA